VLTELLKTATGYATTPTILASFDANSETPDGIAVDKAGNIFGTSEPLFPGTGTAPTLYEVLKTPTGYAARTTLSDSDAGDLLFDPSGNLLGTTSSGGAYGHGGIFEIARTSTGFASTPEIVFSFSDVFGVHGLTVDAHGNLFGIGDGIFEIVKTKSGYANTPITVMNLNGFEPDNSLIVDAVGNLFGVGAGGAYGGGTVFEIAKTSEGYASAPTILVNFCALANCVDGANPNGPLVADANGNLFGTTNIGGTVIEDIGTGTVFEITNSGFVVRPTNAVFAGMPGHPNCHGRSVSALAHQYGGLGAAATALGYSSVQVLQNAIAAYCAG
jgi:hypothetical protein